ncbi:MAG: nucleotide exchange factor GrpE [Micavibrio aeruginosavorus]|uniref:Protein GrpE n=1 Tax=Micavibrio aeruginosavorus TaxID=349221 RepID=A0A2W5PK25_9BACT|nr:MAG: nucleotide exchange factor GrpE [Micavibrio aeruginosavorus]
MSNEPETQPEETPDITPETQADQAEAQSADAAPADLVAAKIKQLEAEALDAKDKMMRALADAENTRRRAVKDREDAGKYAVSSFARDLLDFSDNFHRALAAIPKELHDDERVGSIITGLEAMDAQLLKTFGKHGIKKIEPLDETFNPNFHEVMFEAPVPGKPAGVVIQVVEAGYVLNDRLLRAAKVGVSKGGMGTDHQVDQSA